MLWTGSSGRLSLHLAEHELQSVHISGVITTVLNDMPVHDDIGVSNSSTSTTYMRGNSACVYTVDA